VESLTVKCLQVFFHTGECTQQQWKGLYVNQYRAFSLLEALKILLKYFLFQTRHVNTLFFYSTPLPTDLYNYPFKQSRLVARLQPGITHQYWKSLLRWRCFQIEKIRYPPAWEWHFSCHLPLPLLRQPGNVTDADWLTQPDGDAWIHRRFHVKAHWFWMVSPTNSSGGGGKKFWRLASQGRVLLKYSLRRTMFWKGLPRDTFEVAFWKTELWLRLSNVKLKTIKAYSAVA